MGATTRRSLSIFGPVPDLDGRYLRVVLLNDGRTVHNAFPDHKWISRLRKDMCAKIDTIAYMRHRCVAVVPCPPLIRRSSAAHPLNPTGDARQQPNEGTRFRRHESRPRGEPSGDVLQRGATLQRTERLFPSLCLNGAHHREGIGQVRRGVLDRNRRCPRCAGRGRRCLQDRWGDREADAVVGIQGTPRNAVGGHHISERRERVPRPTATKCLGLLVERTVLN